MNLTQAQEQALLHLATRARSKGYDPSCNHPPQFHRVGTREATRGTVRVLRDLGLVQTTVNRGYQQRETGTTGFSDLLASITGQGWKHVAKLEAKARESAAVLDTYFAAVTGTHVPVPVTESVFQDALQLAQRGDLTPRTRIDPMHESLLDDWANPKKRSAIVALCGVEAGMGMKVWKDLPGPVRDSILNGMSSMQGAPLAQRWQSAGYRKKLATAIGEEALEHVASWGKLSSAQQHMVHSAASGSSYLQREQHTRPRSALDTLCAQIRESIGVVEGAGKVVVNNSGEVKLDGRQIGFIAKKLDTWRATSVAGGQHQDLGHGYYPFKSKDEALKALTDHWGEWVKKAAARGITIESIEEVVFTVEAFPVSSGYSFHAYVSTNGGTKVHAGKGASTYAEDLSHQVQSVFKNARMKASYSKSMPSAVDGSAVKKLTDAIEGLTIGSKKMAVLTVRMGARISWDVKVSALSETTTSGSAPGGMGGAGANRGPITDPDNETPSPSPKSESEVVFKDRGQRPKVLMALWKRFKGMGDGEIKGGQHEVFLTGDAARAMARPNYTNVVLETLPDDKLILLARTMGVLKSGTNEAIGGEEPGVLSVGATGYYAQLYGGVQQGDGNVVFTDLESAQKYMAATKGSMEQVENTGPGGVAYPTEWVVVPGAESGMAEGMVAAVAGGASIQGILRQHLETRKTETALRISQADPVAQEIFKIADSMGPRGHLADKVWDEMSVPLRMRFMAKLGDIKDFVKGVTDPAAAAKITARYGFDATMRLSPWLSQAFIDLLRQRVDSRKTTEAQATTYFHVGYQASFDGRMYQLRTPSGLTNSYHATGPHAAKQWDQFIDAVAQVVGSAKQAYSTVAPLGGPRGGNGPSGPSSGSIQVLHIGDKGKHESLRGGSPRPPFAR